jgi:uncharacterized LabA/DUF88 family protein
MDKQRKEIVYAFIDSQNLNLGISKLKWKLDFQRFRVYLKDKYKVEKAFLFIGFIESNQELYDNLSQFGYELVFKTAIKYGRKLIKGNVDAEIVLHAAKIQYASYDKAIIVSGDGDFFCLHEELLKDGKLKKIMIPNRKGESSLLKKFRNLTTYVEDLRSKVELKSEKTSKPSKKGKGRLGIQHSN